MPTISDFFPSDTSRSSLLAAQRLVAERAITEDDFGELRLIAGVDQSFVDDKIISGIVVLEYDTLQIVKRIHSIGIVNFPYIPTFLSFREGQTIVSAYEKLKKLPDILMVDGAGINHPRRAGLATHIGVTLDVPTIGITKRILCGTGKEPSRAGEASPLMYKGSQIGWLLKSKERSKTIIVAPGHRVSLDSSLSITKACLHGYKLPEPTRLAHQYVTGLKKEIPASFLS